MDLKRALREIAEIHEHLAKGELYRGYRPLPVATAGIVGIVAAFFQPLLLGQSGSVVARPFVVYWVVVAAVAAAYPLAEIAIRYLLQEDEFMRRRTRRVLGQLVPALAAGALLTGALLATDDLLISLLPGLWSIIFGLGLFASRPYLPRAIGWVALFYVGAGTGLLLLSRGGASLSPWGVGGVFGVGQIAAAAVLYWNFERKGDA